MQKLTLVMSSRLGAGKHVSGDTASPCSSTSHPKFVPEWVLVPHNANSHQQYSKAPSGDTASHAAQPPSTSLSLNGFHSTHCQLKPTVQQDANVPCRCVMQIGFLDRHNTHPNAAPPMTSMVSPASMLLICTACPTGSAASRCCRFVAAWCMRAA